MSLKIEFSEEEINDINIRYNERESMSSIGKHYNCSFQVIKRLLKAQNIFDESRKIRRYLIDEHAFSGKINDEKAYWLGFITADGCLKKYTKIDKRIIIKLQTQDNNHLSKFYKFVKSNKKVYFNKNNTDCTAYVSSSIMFEDILSYGISPNKTYITKIPKQIIDSIYEKDFWRGMIDGDGCIWENKYSAGISLAGTKDICDSFLSFINKSGFNTSIKTLKVKNDNNYTITFSSRDTVKLLEILYKDSNIFLDRKFEKSIYLIEKYKNKKYKKRQSKTFNGNIKTIKINGNNVLFTDYLKELGLSDCYNKIYNRIYLYNWDIERAIDIPIKECEVNYVKSMV